MTQNHSLNLSLTLERLIVTSVLAAVITMSLPLRASAAEVMIPNMPIVQADVQPEPSAPVEFTIPSKSAAVSTDTAAVAPAPTVTNVTADQTSDGYKVVRVYQNVPSTAYTSRAQETDDSPFIAADGTHVYDGMVAANFLKFGTKIRIPELFGDKIFTVHDRMNKRYDVKVDVWMADLQPALKYGVHHVTIEVVQPADDNVAVATTQS